MLLSMSDAGWWGHAAWAKGAGGTCSVGRVLQLVIPDLPRGSPLKSGDRPSNLLQPASFIGATGSGTLIRQRLLQPDCHAGTGRKLGGDPPLLTGRSQRCYDFLKTGVFYPLSAITIPVCSCPLSPAGTCGGARQALTSNRSFTAEYAA